MIHNNVFVLVIQIQTWAQYEQESKYRCSWSYTAYVYGMPRAVLLCWGGQIYYLFPAGLCERGPCYFFVMPSPNCTTRKILTFQTSLILTKIRWILSEMFMNNVLEINTKFSTHSKWLGTRIWEETMNFNIQNCISLCWYSQKLRVEVVTTYQLICPKAQN